MIARLWHGYTVPEKADAYEHLLMTQVLPAIHRIDGYRGAHVLRRDNDGETEFITLTLWESMDAIRAFAGDEEAAAVVPDSARALLKRWDEKSTHYRGSWIP